MKQVKTAKLYHDGHHQYVQTDEGLIRCDGLAVKDFVHFRYPGPDGKEQEFCCETKQVKTELFVKSL